MGASVAKVRQQHKDIAVLAQSIQSAASQIVASAKEIGYTRENQTVCQNLAFTYHKKLAQFNRSTLIQVLYNIGLQPSPQDLQKIDKSSICQIIIEYYTRKLDLVDYIQNEINGSCRNTERLISSNIEQMLEGAPSRVQSQAYRRLVSLNSAIETFFTHGYDALKFIVNEDIPPETLSEVAKTVFAQLEKDKQNCCRRAHALRQFAYIPVTSGNKIMYKNMYDNSVAGESLPRVDKLEPEFSVDQLRGAGLCL